MYDLAVLLDYGAAALWALGGEVEALRGCQTLFRDNAHDLRDDVAGALHDDRVAGADVLAFNFVCIVQSSTADDDTADSDWLQLCDRCERAGAADLYRDVVQ